MRNKSVFVLLVLIILLIANPASAVVRYNITDLGTLGGYEGSRAWSINNNGQIVGEAHNFEPPFANRAVLFDTTGGGNNIDLGTLGGENSWAMSINDNGQIVGGAENDFDPSIFCATIFDPSGGGNNTRLGKGVASSINNNGQIVGYSGYIEDSRAVLFDPTGQGNNKDLGTLDGFLYSVAYSINNSGYIIGYAFNFVDYWTSDAHAVLFDPTHQGNNIDLGTLGGDSSVAVSINNNGQIVGRANTTTGFCHAVLFDPTGGGNNIDLGTLTGSNFFVAASINNNGQIVGQAWEVQYDDISNLRAVLFDPTGSGNNIDLNSLINPTLNWVLEAAICINDNNWIVGFGSNSNGDRRAFLLTPVPEPSTILLIALGGSIFKKD